MTHAELSDDVGSTEAVAREVAVSALEVSADVAELVQAVNDAGETRALAEALYDAYRRRDPHVDRGEDREADRQLLQSLRLANGGRGTWDSDWRIESLDDGGKVAVAQGGVVYFADPAEVRGEADGGELVPGSVCRVFVPEERQRLSPGSYLVLGDAPRTPVADLTCVVRLYWHLRVNAARDWVGGLTLRLNRLGVPFRLKVVGSARRFDRADAGVLYLEPSTFDDAWPAVEEVYAEISPRMRSATPRLTLRLAPGLALAEGPADGQSFGRDRTRRIATALIRLRKTSAAVASSLGARCAAVREAFAEAGLDARRPHLEPGSTNGARWERLIVERSAPGAADVDDAPRSVAATSTTRSAVAPSAASPAEAFLAEAVAIGHRLCREAWWHGSRCNWVGRDPGERRERGRIRGAVKALDGSLYCGSAGVGLFLAELAGVTGEERVRRTAIGALERSLDVAEAALGRADAELTTYLTGSLGAIAAARRSAPRVGSEGLVARADRLLEVAIERVAAFDLEASEPLLDLFAGVAGVVVGLSGGGAERSEAVDRVVLALGRHLVAAADVRGERWRWSNRRASGIATDQAPLAGLSHGASGIALALLELFEVSGDRGFLDAARGALGYEDSLFDEGERNWLDLRPLATGGERRFTTAWCHGAPGIALARLRAGEVDGERSAEHRSMATVALARTRDEVASVRGELDDASLCHGLAGRVDVLLVGAERLGDEELEACARDAMLVAMAGREPESWPSGVASRGPNPSLFLGDAGVGYTLLRLAGGVENRRPPSVLLGRIEARGHGSPRKVMPGRGGDGSARNSERVRSSGPYGVVSTSSASAFARSTISATSASSSLAS